MIPELGFVSALFEEIIRPLRGGRIGEGYRGNFGSLYAGGNQTKKRLESAWSAVELNDNRRAATDSGLRGYKVDANGNASERCCHAHRSKS